LGLGSTGQLSAFLSVLFVFFQFFHAVSYAGLRWNAVGGFSFRAAKFDWK
jgi:hypothetical protein